MRLYLMQHALAYSSEENSERALSPAGVEQAKEHCRNAAGLYGRSDPVMLADKNDDPGRNTQDVDGPTDDSQLPLGRFLPTFSESKKDFIEEIKTSAPYL